MSIIDEIGEILEEEFERDGVTHNHGPHLKGVILKRIEELLIVRIGSVQEKLLTDIDNERVLRRHAENRLTVVTDLYRRLVAQHGKPNLDLELQEQDVV